MKKSNKYETPSMKYAQIEIENGFLTGSHIDTQILIQKDFNIHTDSYEDKTFDWDHISFD